MKRLLGRWPNFSAKLEKHNEAICEEWEREIGSWTKEDIDNTFFVLNEPRWKDKLKHYPPSIDDFVQARREIRRSSIISQEIPRYVEFLTKIEKKLMKIVVPNMNAIVWDLLRNVRAIINNIDIKVYVSAFHCVNCKQFAIFIDWDEKPPCTYCFTHCPQKYRDAVLGEKK